MDGLVGRQPAVPYPVHPHPSPRDPVEMQGEPRSISSPTESNPRSKQARKAASAKTSCFWGGANVAPAVHGSGIPDVTWASRRPGAAQRRCLALRQSRGANVRSSRSGPSGARRHAPQVPSRDLKRVPITYPRSNQVCDEVWDHLGRVLARRRGGVAHDVLGSTAWT